MTDEDRITAVHEAGHAVARFLTASEMGIEPAKAVSRIEFQPAIDTRTEGTATVFVIRLATTFGPMLSRNIQAHMATFPFGHHVTGAELETTIAAARAAGVDVAGWCRSRMLIHVFGAVAEARFTNRPVMELWGSDICHSDIEEAVRDGRLAGLSPARIEEAVDAAIDEAIRLVNIPAIWSAIAAVAGEVERLGTVTGPQALEAIARSGAEIGIATS
ncbi:MAG: hypothetical protein KIS96_01340 [Bauldia sp.]|nr:hypothetical protein [Bauldia sp.]